MTNKHTPGLLAACRDHNLTMGPDHKPNPYGTFPDALRNLANGLPDRMAVWAEWLKAKAETLDAAIAKAEVENLTNGGCDRCASAAAWRDTHEGARQGQDGRRRDE